MKIFFAPYEISYRSFKKLCDRITYFSEGGGRGREGVGEGGGRGGRGLGEGGGGGREVVGGGRRGD